MTITSDIVSGVLNVLFVFSLLLSVCIQRSRLPFQRSLPVFLRQTVKNGFIRGFDSVLWLSFASSGSHKGDGPSDMERDILFAVHTLMILIYMELLGIDTSEAKVCFPGSQGTNHKGDGPLWLRFFFGLLLCVFLTFITTLVPWQVGFSLVGLVDLFLLRGDLVLPWACLPSYLAWCALVTAHAWLIGTPFALLLSVAVGLNSHTDGEWSGSLFSAVKSLKLLFSRQNVTLRGGGGNRRANLNNRGTGGKSKQPRDPQPHPAAVAASQKGINSAIQNGGNPQIGSGPPPGPGANGDGVLAPPVDDDKRRRLRNKLGIRFEFAKEPNVETLHDTDLNLRDPDVFHMDCFGAPFCGLVCIDLASGHKPSWDRYTELMVSGDPLDIGTPPFLSSHAAACGVNLVIHKVGMQDYVFQNNLAWRTAHLEHVDVHEVDEQGNPLFVNAANALDYPDLNVGDPIMVGHYRLYCRHSASRVDRVFPELASPLTSYPWWFVWLVLLGLFTSYGQPIAQLIVWLTWFLIPVSYLLSLLWPPAWLLGQFLLSLNGENSALLAAMVVFGVKWFELIGFRDHFVATRYYRDRSNNDRRDTAAKRDPLETQDVYCVVAHTYELLFASHVIWVRWAVNYDISLVRFLDAYSEMQNAAGQGLDPLLGKAKVGADRVVNTNIALGQIFVGTLGLCDAIAPLILRLEPVRHVGIVYCNAPAVEARIGGLPLIGWNQIRGGKGLPYHNHVERFRLERGKQRHVAVCPVEPPRTTKGPLGIGCYSVTDSPGILVAFCGRSMNAPLKVPESVERFVRFSKELCRWFLRNTDFGVEPEPDCQRVFAEEMRGKRTTENISEILTKYRGWLDGTFTRVSWLLGKVFVKDENNTKRTETNECVPKPRLIFMMSEYMMVVLAPILILIRFFQHGPFSKFIIKNLSPAEMIAKIVELSEGPHTTTDYSSFEASTDWFIRAIENYLMVEMAKKAGWFTLARHLRSIVYGMHKMTCEWGIIHCYSRWSGVYWTSFGNGWINFCLQAWCAHLKYGWTADQIVHALQSVVEGDDGLVKRSPLDVQILSELGYKFSANLSGNNPGDCDFLRSRWVRGARYLDIGRRFKDFFVRAPALKRSKQLWLLRCNGRSLYELSPGHPVLTAIVNRIGRETRGITKFKNYLRYLEQWNLLEVEKLEGSYPRNVAVREDMRQIIAMGAPGFPPMPIWLQVELERRIERDSIIYIGSLLNDWTDFRDMTDTTKYQLPYFPVPSQDFKDLLQILASVVRIAGLG